MTEPKPAAGGGDHYSYAHYANRDVAEGFDTLRFGGPIGLYLLETQQRLLLDAAEPRLSQPGARGSFAALDVGTGTGRAALALAQAGAQVVGVDASNEMLDVARARATQLAVAARFEHGDAHALTFADGAFDLAVSFRVLMHTPDWRRCVSELCRVSRWRVVVDFPALGSAAALESGARRLRHAMGTKVEAYRVMSERSVRDAFAARGFRVVSTHRQFVLPIALHKAVGSLGVTKGVESALAAIGLRRAFGSPVTMVAER